MTAKPKDNYKRSPSQLFNFARDCYLDRTSRPIYALVYLLGFIVFYEIGSIIINPEILNRSLAETQIRVVSFVWLQSLLEYIGFSNRMTWVATPLAVVVILVALQITSRTKWSVRLKDFIPMTIECILLAAPLIVLTLVVNRSAPYQPNIASNNFGSAVCLQTAHDTGIQVKPPSAAQAKDCRGGPKLFVNIVTGIGAGIYEELVFRLVLICLLMLLFQDILLISRKNSIILSVLIAAVLFSVHHHIYFVYGHFQAGEAFSVAKFIFRTLAGVYFAVLFAVRGFGIAAGTHAFYNIIAVLLNTMVVS